MRCFWKRFPFPKTAEKRLVILENVSEQKAAARALRKSEERYRILFENANDAIFIIQDGILKFPNGRTLKGLGYTAEELSGMHFADFVHPEDRESVIDQYRKRLKGEPVPRYTRHFAASRDPGKNSGRS